jgi:hypothetical protein
VPCHRLQQPRRRNPPSQVGEVLQQIDRTFRQHRRGVEQIQGGLVSQKQKFFCGINHVGVLS